MACHNYRLPCGHSVFGVCGCAEIEKIAAEMVEQSAGSLSFDALRPYLLRAFQHGAELQRAIDKDAVAHVESLS